MRRRAHLPIYVAALLATLAVASLAKAQTQSADQTARRACAADIQTLCPPAVRGSGGLGQCMLGSGLIDHSQNITVAAMQMAEKKVWAHRS